MKFLFTPIFKAIWYIIGPILRFSFNIVFLFFIGLMLGFIAFFDFIWDFKVTDELCIAVAKHLRTMNVWKEFKNLFTKIVL